jgi:hypothetical protein
MNPPINNLSAAANAKIKADINANQTLLNLANAGDYQVLADHYNTDTAAFWVWAGSTPVETILNQITFSAMTPVDTPDATQPWANRSLAAQGKQFNLQNLIMGRQSIPSGRSNYRAALQDCLTGLPTGVGGATLAANWVGVRDSMKRLATRIEQVLATGTGTFATPADLGGEGRISPAEISLAWTS